MKYSLEGFMQSKLVELSLKYDDALILRWLIDFAACGKMKRVVKENDEHEKNVYYWVNYQAVIDEFPCLYFESVKSIQRKFAKYVELGLLNKIVYSGGSNGMQSFYSINQKLLELEYSTTPAAPKIVLHEKNIKTSSKKVVKEDNHSEKEEKSGVDRIVQSKETDNLQWTELSSPKLPVDTNVQSRVDTDVQSVYINSSTKNSSTTLSNQSITSKAAERENILTESVKSLFDNSLAMFSDDLIPKLMRLTESLEERLLKLYVKYVYNLVKLQKPKKPQGMFYKFVLQNNTFNAFKDSLSGNNGKKVQTWICPICGKTNNFYEDCSECGTFFNDRKNEQYLNIQRQIFKLPLSEKNKLKDELNQMIINEKGFENYRKFQFAKNEIYKKYGISV